MQRTVPHPGQVLQERFLEPLGLSAYQVAKAIGVHVSRVSLLVQGRRALTADTAMRLGLYFGVPAKWWMDLQSKYELDDPKRLASLGAVIQPLERPPGVAIGPSGVRRFHIEHSDPEVETSEVPDSLLERLRAQVQSGGGRPSTSVQHREVDLGAGYRALLGSDS